MEHHKADVWQVAGRGTAGDDTARFLRELRQLRDAAGLGHAELAARAHYPFDSIKAAEVGPMLPDLPVLSAYVRGCGGTAEEWEERWRRLTRAPSLPVSESRHAGNSAAATAGARIGAATQVVDAPDASIIMAALSRVAEVMAGAGPDMEEAAQLTIPPQPAFPGDDAPADVSPAIGSLADVSLPGLSLDDVSLGDISLDDMSLGRASLDDMSLSDVSLAGSSLSDVSLGDDPFTAARPAGSVADPVASPADFSAEPAAGDRPKGWDPIRVSAAWPTIGSEDPRRTEASAGGSKAGSATAGVSRPAIRQSAWSSSADASGEPAGVARPGSRARALIVAVVLVCVVAVLLAIFA